MKMRRKLMKSVTGGRASSCPSSLEDGKDHHCFRFDASQYLGNKIDRTPAIVARVFSKLVYAGIKAWHTKLYTNNLNIVKHCSAAVVVSNFFAKVYSCLVHILVESWK